MFHLTINLLSYRNSNIRNLKEFCFVCVHALFNNLHAKSDRGIFANFHTKIDCVCLVSPNKKIYALIWSPNQYKTKCLLTIYTFMLSLSLVTFCSTVNLRVSIFSHSKENFGWQWSVQDNFALKQLKCPLWHLPEQLHLMSIIVLSSAIFSL